MFDYIFLRREQLALKSMLNSIVLIRGITVAFTGRNALNIYMYIMGDMLASTVVLVG